MMRYISLCIIILAMLVAFNAHAMPTATTISERGYSVIKKHEGYMPCRYLDSGGYPTIGWGHLINGTENIGACITREKAVELLIKDVEWADKCVARKVNARLVQPEYDPLVSLTYNIGCGAFGGSTLLRLLNAGEYDKAGAEFLKWRKSGGRVIRGLEIRRAKEKARWDCAGC